MALPRLTPSLIILAAIFVIGGVMHFVKPGWYLSMMPPWLPAPLALVYISGVAEFAGGVGILIPATRVAAGWGLILLLIAIFPANVQMLLDAHARHASALWLAALVARLPLQAVLIAWVYRAAVRFGGAS